MFSVNKKSFKFWQQIFSSNCCHINDNICRQYVYLYLALQEPLKPNIDEIPKESQDFILVIHFNVYLLLAFESTENKYEKYATFNSFRSAEKL